MIAERELVGWMVFIDYQFKQGHGCQAPFDIIDALRAKGWVEKPDDPDWDGKQPMKVTQAGMAIADLNAPEWGIEPDFVDSD
jgi:hypothetical protein